MTKWEAVKTLEKVMDTWLDFEYWAYCHLEMRGEFTQKRMSEVLENHERAEKRLNEYKAETLARQVEMKEAGATKEERDADHRSRWDEHDRLVAAWRSLEGARE